MFNIEKIKEKEIKRFEKGLFLREFLENGFTKKEFRLKDIKESEFVKNYKKLYSEIEKLKKKEFIVFEEKKFKNIGFQKIPKRVVFENIDKYLDFIDKKEEFYRFLNFFKKSEFKEFIKEKPKILLDNLDIWDKILAVVTFFKNNPKPNIYIRELPIRGVDSKFIQKNRVLLNLLLEYVLDEKFYDKEIKNLKDDFSFEKKYFLKFPKKKSKD